MKVGINSKPLPRPLDPAVGGIISSLGGSALSGGFGLLGAHLQHKYEKENMAIQNQYAIEAEQRANSHNDPSAVRARMESAGMNPQAFMGQSSNAGIQGGMSSAPTASTSASVGSIDTSGISSLGSVLAQQETNEINLKRVENEAQVLAEEAKSKALANAREEFLQKNGDLFRELNEKGWRADVAQVEAFKARVDQAWYRMEKQNAFDLTTAEIDEMQSSVEKYEAEVAKLKSEKKIDDQQYLNLLAENDIILERLKTQQEVTKTQKALTAEVKSRENLNDEQARKLVAETYQGWVSIGIDGANTILHIVDVISPFLKKPRQQVTKEVEEIVNYDSKGKKKGSTTKNLTKTIDK